MCIAPNGWRAELTWIRIFGWLVPGVDAAAAQINAGAEQGDPMLNGSSYPSSAFVDDLVRYGIPAVTDRRRSSAGGHIAQRVISRLLDVTFAMTHRLIASALGPPRISWSAPNHDVLVCRPSRHGARAATRHGCCLSSRRHEAGSPTGGDHGSGSRESRRCGVANAGAGRTGGMPWPPVAAALAWGRKEGVWCRVGIR